MAIRLTNTTNQIPILNQALQDIDTLKKQIAALQSAAPAIQTWIPQVTSVSGAWTTVAPTGRFAQIGPFIFFTIYCKFVNIGTGTQPIFSLPLSGNGQFYSCTGVEIKNTGLAWTGMIPWQHNNLLIARRYDNGNIASNGDTLLLSGFYEALI